MKNDLFCSLKDNVCIAITASAKFIQQLKALNKYAYAAVPVSAHVNNQNARCIFFIQIAQSRLNSFVYTNIAIALEIVYLQIITDTVIPCNI